MQKGAVGEAIVKRHLEARGLIVYEPATAGRHPFDKLCSSADKRSIVIAEVKAKPARRFFPDTGINLSHYTDYCTIRCHHKLRVFLYFVDEDAGKVYGNDLAELEKPRTVTHRHKRIDYPLTQDGIIYFPLEAMRIVGCLTAHESKRLVSLSTRSQEYADAKNNHDGLGLGPLFEGPRG